MLDTFKAQLKAKAKTLGVTNLSNKRIDAYAAALEKQNPNLATDDDHAEKVDLFLELVDIKEVAQMDDRNRSAAAKGGKDEKKEDKPGSDKKEDVEEPADDPTEPAWAKALRKQNEQLAQNLAALQKKDQTATMQERLKKNLKDVPESFYKKWQLPEKEEDMEAFEEEVKTEWAAFTKENPIQTSTGGTTHRPARGGSTPDGKPSETDVKDIISQM